MSATTKFVAVGVALLGLAARAGGGAEAVTAAALGIALTTDRDRYAPGDTIAAELVVSNRAGHAVTLHFMSGQRYDFSIEDPKKKVVWRWSADRMFTQMLGEETLGPGREELVYRERLPAPRALGTYRVVGTVVASDRPMSVEVTVTVGN